MTEDKPQGRIKTQFYRVLDVLYQQAYNRWYDNMNHRIRAGFWGFITDTISTLY